MGYVVIWVQVDGAQGYDKDQIALVILDLSNLVARVPIILGTPTISCIVNMIKEKEIDALVMPWVNCLGGLSFVSLTSYSHNGKCQDCCWGVRP